MEWTCKWKLWNPIYLTTKLIIVRSIKILTTMKKMGKFKQQYVCHQNADIGVVLVVIWEICENIYVHLPCHMWYDLHVLSSWV